MRAKPFRDAQRVRLMRLRQQDRELFTAEPAGQVITSQLLAQRTGDRLERLVARQVAVGVVDHLEMIYVHQGD